MTDLVGRELLNTFVDTTSSATYIYIGKAEIGTATSAAEWLVFRVDKTNGADITFANAGEPDQIWDNRVSLTYT